MEHDKKKYGNAPAAWSLWLLVLVSAPMSAGMASVAVAEEARLSAGDALEVTVPGPSPSKVKARIERDGSVDLGVYGRSVVGGMTLYNATLKIRKDMEVFIRDTSSVQVRLVETAALIYVTGCVNQPGLVELTSDRDPLLAITKAGGHSKCADLSRVVLKTPAATSTIDLQSYLERPQEQSIPPLQSGTTLIVPAQRGLSVPLGELRMDPEVLEERIFVLGAVNNPGHFPRQGVTTIWQALALSAGPKDGALLHSIRVLGGSKHRTRNALDPVDASLPHSGALIIYVPSAAEVAQSRGVTVLGAVNRPGKVPTAKPISLIEAIGRAGGTNNRAELDEVYVLRTTQSGTLTMRFNLEHLLQKGGQAVHFRLQPGDTLSVGQEKPSLWKDGVEVASDLTILATAVALLAGL